MNRKAITIVAASFALFGVSACKPLPDSINRIISVNVPSQPCGLTEADPCLPDPACPTVASCLPQGTPPPTTVQPCGTTEADPCSPDPACPTVAGCLPPGPPTTTTEPKCGLTEANPCP